MPRNNVHRRALRSVSPRKEARKSTDKGSNPLPPAEPPLEPAGSPTEAEEPEVELRRPTATSRIKELFKSNKGKPSAGTSSKPSAAPPAGPAVKLRDNPRPTSLPAPKASTHNKKYEGSYRLKEVAGEPTKRWDHGKDESQMRLETQARAKDVERKKARDRSLSNTRLFRRALSIQMSFRSHLNNI